MAIPYSGDSLQTDKRKRMLNEFFFTPSYLYVQVSLCIFARRKQNYYFFYSFILYVQVCFGRKMIRELNDTFINP